MLVLILRRWRCRLNRWIASSSLRKIRSVGEARPFTAIAVKRVLSGWSKLLEDKAVRVEVEWVLHELPFILGLVHQILVLISLEEAGRGRCHVRQDSFSAKLGRIVIWSELKFVWEALVEYVSIKMVVVEGPGVGLVLIMLKAGTPLSLFAETGQKRIHKSLACICYHNLFLIKILIINRLNHQQFLQILGLEYEICQWSNFIT